MHTADYRPAFQRGNFQSTFEPRYASRYMGQIPTPEPSTAPAPAIPAPTKVNIPLVLGVSAGSGALLGFLGTILWQKLDKRMQQGAEMRLFGAVGGLLGGLTGAGTILLLKD